MDNNNHEERIAKLEAARIELEDAFIVMTHLETKQSNVIKGLAERQAERDEFERVHRLKMLEFDEKMLEINDKLNALIDIVGRQQGGMEAH